jgi:HAMP domain-containing protein
MTLRFRLLFGYGYLVALVLVAAGSALLGFLQLSAGIGVVLEENVKSIGAAMRMIEALDGQHGGTLAALVEGRPPDAETAADDLAFRDALAVALANVTEEAEPDVLAAIERDYAAYRRACEELLAARPERPVGAYEAAAAPHYAAVRSGAFRLLDINHGAMVEADRRARRSALANGAWLGALVAVSLLSFGVLSRAIQRHILARLDHLRRGSEAVAEGETRRRLHDRADDELGRVAAAVNRLLDRLQQTAGRAGAEVRRERRLALALLASHGPGAAVFDTDGRLLAGEPAAATETRVREWLEAGGAREAVAGGHGAAAPVPRSAAPVALGGGLDASPLGAPAGGTVAWLVRPAVRASNRA